MPLVKRSCIESIKNRVNIYDVASPYVHLKKSGANWVGLSPFSNEKTPSFYVLPEKNIFKCFSSGHAGDIFRFLQLKENLNFQESVEWLARHHSIELEYEEGNAANAKQQSLRKDLFEIHEIAADYFEQAFEAKDAEGTYVREYWTKNRKFNLELAKKCKIGLAPSTEYPLHALLFKKGFTPNALSESGLFFIRNNHYLPRFRGRLIIPIRDVQGRIIAFTARKLDITPQDHPSAEAKYINSPETPIFNKSHILFGLEEARKHVAKEEPFILVEGQLDVLRFWQNNIFLAIAPQGTSITESQLSLVKRYTSRLDCFLDGDTAGQKAALRFLPMAFHAGLEARFIPLPDGQDPDTLLMEGGANALEIIRKNSLSPIAFALNSLLPPNQTHSARAKAEALQELYAIIQQCDSQVVKNECLEEISKLTCIENHAVEADFKQFIKKQPQRYSSPEEISIPPLPSLGKTDECDKIMTAEHELLVIILQHPEVAKPLARIFSIEWIEVFSLHSILLVRFLTELGENLRENLEPIDELLESDEERNLVYNILGHTLVFDNPTHSANLCLKIIFNAYINKQKKQLEETIAQTPPSEEYVLKSLLQERIRLRKALQNPPRIEQQPEAVI